jgi:carbamate kinase
MVEVDPKDPAFEDPTKPIGPMYTREQAEQLAREKGWVVAEDGAGWRRVVASPLPKRIFEMRPIKWLLEHNTIVVCAGGGGIPTMYRPDGTLAGAEVVIDKDRASAVLAREVGADLFVMATDVPGVYADWGTSRHRLLRRTTPDELRALRFARGSMGPKVEAAIAFVEETGGRAAIGSLGEIERIVAGDAGTIVERG